MASPKKLVLDTNVIVDHLRGKDGGSLVRRLQKESELATTMINAFELYYGAYKSKSVAPNLASVKGFLSAIDVLDIDEASMEEAGRVLAALEKKGAGIDSRDLFVGCVSVVKGFAVLTNNHRHLGRIPNLLVFTPSEVS